MNTAAVPNRVTTATAKATWRGGAPMTGAVAMTAELPHTAAPTARSTASVRSMPAVRAASEHEASACRPWWPR